MRISDWSSDVCSSDLASSDPDRSGQQARTGQSTYSPPKRIIVMSYAIIGFGSIGQALARAFARNNIEVTVASRRPPEALLPQAQAIDRKSTRLNSSH